MGTRLARGVIEGALVKEGSAGMSCSGWRRVLWKRRKTKIAATRHTVAKITVMIMFLRVDLGEAICSGFCRAGFGSVKCGASLSISEMCFDLGEIASG